ncbi:MAG: CRISPR-associated helicase Cas3' [Bacteroidales bacterium]|jgi:CRISPR-associated endonuclease/helicase Cas3|nr:CRISPR-associated helicase Cas3' [Bacteroidales bacterium]
MSLFRSFRQISDEYNDLEKSFEKKIVFHAHTHPGKKQETLHEHISKVKEYFNALVNIHGIENTVDNLISKISFSHQEIGEYIKTLFLHSIIFHDFGKINDNFQAERMRNALFKSDKTIKIGFEHSFLSAYIFLNYHLSNINKSNFTQSSKSILWVYTFLFSIPILKHHSGYLLKDYDFDEVKVNSIHKFHKIVGSEIPIEFTRNFIKNENHLWEYFDKIANEQKFDFFPLFALLKLNYSLLTASDYYATSDYMTDLKLDSKEDFGLITDVLKKRIFKYFENNEKAKYNGELIRDPQKYLSKNIDELKLKSNPNLNFLRQKLGAEILTNIKKQKSQKIFYIEAPTGGGKTNMSIIAARMLLELHPEINKVFYVFPFTTLITQTAKAIKDTLGLNNDEIAQVHSKAGFHIKKYSAEQDARYGNEQRNQIDNLFINYPFTLLTHIKFFDILKSNKKDANYLLHRMVNSIVIIDELQSYSPEHWDKIKYFISQYSELFNIWFIIMSATLPKIDAIKFSDFQFANFEPLVPDAKKYLQNPNFAERVAIKTDLLAKTDIELEELANIVFDKSRDYAKSRDDVFKNSIYTIIEFIFKKSASKFYDICFEKNEESKFFDEIFVLSGTIIEPRRKYIIEFLKDESNRKKKVLLVTTQVVEAGVDIDMDLGFKNQSLIDSDEQLAGRINRNVNKKNCELWLFKHDTPKSIYGKDLRYEVSREFDQEFIEEILTIKDFGKLYERVFEEIDKRNDSAYKTNLYDYLLNFKNLKFQEIQNEFKLIDSENASVFVPADIDIKCYKTENNFSAGEVDFIRRNNFLNDFNEKQVSGEKVWDFYVTIIQNKEINFAQKNRDLKILNGIMSKFIFSVFMKKIEDLERYFDYNENKSDYKFFQYFKLNKANDIYSLEGGINEKELDKSFVFI